MKLGIYRHFKGKEYLVIGVATHSESSEQLVVYLPLYGDYKLTVRPLEMFSEIVERDNYKGPRFEFIKTIGGIDHANITG